jgi:hypothetical protein
MVCVTWIPPHVSAPAVHAPDWQVSGPVHAFPSLHELPFVFGGFEQTPVAGLHVPATWHWSGIGHITKLPPVQTPAWQLDVPLQASLSLHDAPFALGGFEHAPASVPQAPAS